MFSRLAGRALTSPPAFLIATLIDLFTYAIGSARRKRKSRREEVARGASN